MLDSVLRKKIESKIKNGLKDHSRFSEMTLEQAGKLLQDHLADVIARGVISLAWERSSRQACRTNYPKQVNDSRVIPNYPEIKIRGQTLVKDRGTMFIAHSTDNRSVDLTQLKGAMIYVDKVPYKVRSFDRSGLEFHLYIGEFNQPEPVKDSESDPKCWCGHPMSMHMPIGGCIWHDGPSICPCIKFALDPVLAVEELCSCGHRLGDHSQDKCHIVGCVCLGFCSKTPPDFNALNPEIWAKEALATMNEGLERSKHFEWVLEAFNEAFRASLTALRHRSQGTVNSWEVDFQQVQYAQFTNPALGIPWPDPLCKCGHKKSEHWDYTRESGENVVKACNKVTCPCIEFKVK